METETIQELHDEPANVPASKIEVDEHQPLDVVEDEVLMEDGSHPLISLLTGLPSQSQFWNIVSLGIGALCLLMTLDLVYRGPVFYSSQKLSFSRIGYVSHDQAKIIIREPNPDQFPIFLSYKSLDSIEETWIAAAKTYLLDVETDYTWAVNLTKLHSSTRYAYSASNGQSGTFTTMPPPGAQKLSFVTSSCIKYRFPYSIFDHPLRIKGLEILSDWIPVLKPSFMLFLGDFIYIDVPRRLGSDPEAYRAEYRRVYASPSWTRETRSLPWLNVIDDHEIANDWDRGWEKPYPAAIDPFNIYHHSVNPPHLGNASYYTFTQGPASFFLLDTRRYRTPVWEQSHNDSTKTMLGAKQLQEVLLWLAKPEPAGIRWKILVTSVPFTRNWRLNAQDTWSGYLAERQTILEAMWDTVSKPSGPGIVILSGDRHEFSATSFPAPILDNKRWAMGTKVTEFSCSPLNMFYLPVRSYYEVPGEQSGIGYGGEDISLAYIPDGNVKFGAIDIENEIGSRQSTLRYRAIIDGTELWSHVLATLDGKERTRDAVWG